MSPEDVSTALSRMRAGDASDEVFATIVAAAEAFAALTTEWGFPSPQTGLMYVTQNDLLAETLIAARPDVRVLERLAPPFPSDREEGNRG